MSDQLKNTLSYRPPQPKKQQIMSDVQKTVERQEVNISNSLKELEENLPSKVLGKADVAIAKVAVAMSEIEAKLKRNTSNGVSFAKYQEALEGDDFDTVESFESGHRDSITGDPAGELYGSLYYVSKDLAASKALVASNNYEKPDVNADILGAQDRQVLDQMIRTEQSVSETDGSTSVETSNNGINYDSVYLDTAINASMGEYFDNSGSFADGVLSVVDSESEQDDVGNIDDKEVVRSLMEGSFSSENSMNLKDVHKMRQLDRSSIRLQTQTTMYEKRNRSISNGNVEAKIANITNSSMKTSLSQQSHKDHSKAVANIVDLKKINKMESMYRRDLLSSVGSKQKLRSFHGIL